jgi:hypothetical protein
MGEVNSERKGVVKAVDNASQEVAHATHETPFSPLREKGRDKGAVMTYMIWGVPSCHDR